MKTNKTTAEEASAQQAAATENQQTASTVEAAAETTAELDARIEQLQKEATGKLNELWDAMEKRGYKLYNHLIFMGAAFEVVGNARYGENERYKPRTLSSNSVVTNDDRGLTDEKQEAAPVYKPKDKTETINVSCNHGLYRSVRVGANDNTIPKK